MRFAVLQSEDDVVRACGCVRIEAGAILVDGLNVNERRRTVGSAAGTYVSSVR